MVDSTKTQARVNQYISDLEQENKSLIEENQTLKFWVRQFENEIRFGTTQNIEDYFEKTRTLVNRILTNYNGLSEKYRLLNNKIESLNQRVGELEILKDLKELKYT